MTKRLLALASVLVGLCIGAPMTRAEDFSQLTARQPLLVKGVTKTPVGARQFCLDHPADCRPPETEPLPGDATPLTPTAWSELDEVNRRFNSAIRPMTDEAYYARREYWTYPDTVGDCEDYALAKRRALLQSGWPAQSLRIALVRQSNGDAHAVLVAVTSMGDYVLDNLVGDVLGWDETNYRFVKMQTAETLDKWVELEDHRPLWVASR